MDVSSSYHLFMVTDNASDMCSVYGSCLVISACGRLIVTPVTGVKTSAAWKTDKTSPLIMTACGTWAFLNGRDAVFLLSVCGLFIYRNKGCLFSRIYSPSNFGLAIVYSAHRLFLYTYLFCILLFNFHLRFGGRNRGEEATVRDMTFSRSSRWVSMLSSIKSRWSSCTVTQSASLV